METWVRDGLWEAGVASRAGLAGWAPGRAAGPAGGRVLPGPPSPPSLPSAAAGPHIPNVVSVVDLSGSWGSKNDPNGPSIGRGKAGEGQSQTTPVPWDKPVRCSCFLGPALSCPGSGAGGGQDRPAQRFRTKI